MKDFATPETLTAAIEEIEALRALLRKTQRSVGWWAALSYPDGVNHDESTCRWTSPERAALHRAGL